ncbi:MAG: DUF1573 domain-containing protein, partial [Verrucomicrobia bacterium]|nr:DUF1573 domain-containing protein [Verrucomicrobiota bacterium]
LSLCSFTAIPLLAAPRMVCDSPKHDFGTLIGSEKITHEFVLWNRGSSPVVISKIKNCCGVTSSIKPMEILPGSNAVCKAVFTTRNRYGKQDKQILIASNDRRRPYFELKMTGTLQRPVEFSPRLLRLGVLYPDSSVSQTITATNLLEKAVMLESIVSKVKGIEATVDGIGLSSIALAKGDDPVSVDNRDLGSRLQKRSWAIRLSSPEPLAVGKLNGMIQLNFSSGLVKVPIIGIVRPIIQMVPEQIQFSSRSSKATERLVMLRSGDGRPFEVLSAKLEKGEGSVETKKLAEGRWQLKVAVVPDGLSPGSAVQVQTSYKGQSKITVPLSVRVK